MLIPNSTRTPQFRQDETLSFIEHNKLNPVTLEGQLERALLGTEKPIEPWTPPAAVALARAEMHMIPGLNSALVLSDPSASPLQKVVAVSIDVLTVVGVGAVLKVGRAGVAAVSEGAGAIGFADNAVTSAYQGMRSGGGHAMRHLIDEGLISNSGSLASRAELFQDLTAPILRSPTRAFDWRVGNPAAAARAFTGEVGGRNVVVSVAKEGPYQGRVLSTIVPDATQVAQWGL